MNRTWSARSCLLGMFFALVLSRGAWGKGETIKLYVSPDGKDTWSGRVETPLKDGSDGPLASLAAARRAVRVLRRKAGEVERPVVVEFAAGTYRMSQTVVFTAEDSGSLRAPVVYRARPGAKAVLSGGRVITRWKKDPSGKYWTAAVPGVKDGAWYFRQLFVDDRRAVCARRPNVEDYWFHIERQLQPYADGIAVYRAGDIKAWPELKQIEMVLLRKWNFSRFRLDSVDEKTRTVRLHIGRKEESMRRWKRDRRYYLENSLRFLDAPGEWYLDREKGVLYLRPFREETFPRATVVAPALERLIVFKGAPARPVEFIRFEGLSFEHSTWSVGEGGYNGHQADVAAHAAVMADYVRYVDFRRCTFRHLGRYALQYGKGCRNNRITRNEFTDLGGGAVLLGSGARAGRAEYETTGNEISYNDIHDCGRVWHGSCGIWVGSASYTHIHHNHVHDLPYTGISVGWTWSDNPSGAHHNVIEYNHVHDVMTFMGDGGCIYTLGRQDGTVIRNNVLHDAYGWNGQANGIYTDQGSSGMTIENNLVARVLWGGIGAGTNDNVVRNNIVVLTGKVALGTYHGDRRRWERNIVYIKEGFPLDLRLKGEDNRFDRNLYWDAGGEGLQFPGGRDFAEWQKAGYDSNSLVADPLFVDVEKGDFNLRPGSPAFKLGFVPFRVPVIGPGSTDPRSSVRLSRLYSLRPLAGADGAPAKRPLLRARPRGGKKIVIDGVVADGEWDLGAKVPLRESSSGKVPDGLASSLCVQYDAENLYVLLITPVKDPKNLRAKGAVWGADDGAEICLQGASDKKRGPVFVVQGFASGAVKSVTVGGAPEEAARRLGRSVAYAARVEPRRWVAEWKIPLAPCGVKATANGRLRFNIGVRRAYERLWVSWVYTGGANWELRGAGDLMLAPAKKN